MKNVERTSISKNKIIDSAMIDFSQNGYSGFSLNQFCSNYDISKGKFYHHFDGKEKLFLACVEKCYLEFAEWIRAFEVNSNASYEENLHNYFELRQIYIVDNHHRARVMYQVSQWAPESLREPLKELRSEFQNANGKGLFEILKDVPLQRGVSINMIIKTFELASSYVHTVYGAAKWYAEGDRRISVQDTLDVFDSVMKVLLYGILPREEI